MPNELTREVSKIGKAGGFARRRDVDIAVLQEFLRGGDAALDDPSGYRRAGYPAERSVRAMTGMTRVVLRS